MDKHETCQWGTTSEIMLQYHNTEWGVPVHDDRKLFEYLILDAFQAGLSWSTILNKRENFRKAFDHFDWKKIALYSESKEAELLQDSGIIRNKLKVKAAITNAQAFMKVIEEHGSFDAYIWRFVGNKPIVNQFKTMSDIPAVSPEAEVMSKDLKKRGFKFVGPTIIYAFMQAAGMVNDHIINCKRHEEVKALY
ncbi:MULTISPECIES: DNA-3-methyladenine glycosylase I [unclassified Saccharicrinis]|uniref:DNA-3-methyladenine glycosylase I n=1 Tax=unclassified Saccharicrinis TaxID=2646859 RepID=UPI003D34094F